MTTNCLRCQKPYERNRASEHFCDLCAEAVDRETERERSRERYERGKHAVASCSHMDWARDIADESLEDIGLAMENGDPSILLDKMPDGASSPYGPEEGYSTFFTDLQGELKELRKVSAGHEWWTQHPHVFFAVHDPVRAAVYNIGVSSVCGTYAGYMRHYRAKEMACPACADANAERSREKRAA